LSWGGKSGRTAAFGTIEQAVEALALEAAAPLGNGIGMAAQFLGDVVIAWNTRTDRTVEDNAGAKGKRLGRGGGTSQFVELLFFVER